MDDLALALAAADAADAISLPGFRGRSFFVDHKADASEVTDIDRATERAIREVLETNRPGCSIYGEEYGESGGAAREQWVIDPIDGTSNFVRGVPVWATLIALVVDDAPVLGVVSAPALGSRWWATPGGGAFRDGIRLAVSAVASLEEAHVATTLSRGWIESGRLGALHALETRARRARGFGDFWQHMLVAEGALDVAVDAIGLQPYDTAAIWPIVREAGGTITDRFGADDWRGDTMVSSNGVLHDEVIALLSR